MADLPAKPSLDHLRRQARDEVAARTASLARQVEAFCEASIRDGTGRAVRMLAATPEIARYGFATAVILGDADRVRTELGRDPGLATRSGPRACWPWPGYCWPGTPN